jgi:cytochrome c peroxidase
MRCLIIICILSTLFACNKDEDKESTLGSNKEEPLLRIPEAFPPVNFPTGNELTKARWDLGKRLFYEKKLSIDQSISCGSCHKAALAFADDRALSPGVYNRPGVRNAPSLANVAYQPYLLREGSVPTLEMQVLVPIQEHNEFNHNLVDIVDELGKDSLYQQQSKLAYNRSFDAFVLTRAISLFQRTMISGNSPYDQYTFQGKSAALTNAERRGMDLFFDTKTKCSTCHSGFNFTNYSFQNNGLDSIYKDQGRFRFSNDSADLAKFKVPSLRNVALTAPYMHDGRFSSLEEVIEHYNSGGAKHRNKHAAVHPLQLSQQEKQDLLAFLHSLTDFDFVNDPRWREE